MTTETREHAFLFKLTERCRRGLGRRRRPAVEAKRRNGEIC